MTSGIDPNTGQPSFVPPGDQTSPFAALANTPSAPAQVPPPSALREQGLGMVLGGLGGASAGSAPVPAALLGGLAGASAGSNLGTPPPTPQVNPDAGMLGLGAAPAQPPVDTSNTPGPFALGSDTGPQSSTFEQGPGGISPTTTEQAGDASIPAVDAGNAPPSDAIDTDPNSGIRWNPQIKMFRDHAESIRAAAAQMQVPMKPGMNWMQALIGIAGAIAANGNPKNNFVPQYMQGLAQENERQYGNTMEAFQKTRQDMLNDAQILEGRANGIQQSQEAIYKAQQGVYGQENRGIGAAQINAANKLTLQQAALKNKLDLTDMKVKGDLAKAQTMVDGLKAQDLTRQESLLFAALLNPNSTAGTRQIAMTAIQKSRPDTFGSVPPNVLQAAIDQSGPLANLANERAETQNQVRDLYKAQVDKLVQDGKLDVAHVNLLTKQLSMLDPEFQLEGAKVLGDLMLRTKELQIKAQDVTQKGAQGKGDPNAVVQNESKALEGAAGLYKSQVGAILARNNGKPPSIDSDDATPYKVAMDNVNTIAARLYALGALGRDATPKAALAQVPDIFGDDPASAAIQTAEQAITKSGGKSMAPIPGLGGSPAGPSHVVPRDGDAFEKIEFEKASNAAARSLKMYAAADAAKAIAAIWNHYNQTIGQHRQGQ